MFLSSKVSTNLKMDYYYGIYVFLFYSLFFVSVKGCNDNFFSNYHYISKANFVVMSSSGSRLRVDLRSNGPAVLDSNITFTATLSYPSGVKPVGPFYCVFSDNNMLSWTVSSLLTLCAAHKCLYTDS